MRGMRLALVALLLGGCTVYETNGGDDDVGPPGSGPIGRQFFVERVRVSESPCPPFMETDAPHTVVVEQSSVFVDDLPAGGAAIRGGPAREEAGDLPNLAFAVFESWTSNEGFASPQVQYEMWVDGALVTGKASTAFQHQGPAGPVTCTYGWMLNAL